MPTHQEEVEAARLSALQQIDRAMQLWSEVQAAGHGRVSNKNRDLKNAMHEVVKASNKWIEKKCMQPKPEAKTLTESDRNKAFLSVFDALQSFSRGEADYDQEADNDMKALLLTKLGMTEEAKKASNLDFTQDFTDSHVFEAHLKAEMESIAQGGNARKRAMQDSADILADFEKAAGLNPSSRAKRSIQ